MNHLKGAWLNKGKPPPPLLISLVHFVSGPHTIKSEFKSMITCYLIKINIIYAVLWGFLFVDKRWQLLLKFTVLV
jgi:hypothetical protein